MLGPSKGSVMVCGYDVAKQTAFARKNVSYCPQHDVFFDDLSVQKHVHYYANVSSPKMALLLGFSCFFSRKENKVMSYIEKRHTEKSWAWSRTKS